MKKINLIPLRYIEDERGAVLHFVKKTDLFFENFGENYFSWINPGIIKGWYRHTQNISWMTSPTANLQVVLCEDEIKHIFSVINITKLNYGLIKIPVGVWYAFRSLNDQPALISNILSAEYDANELERLPIDTNWINFTWTEHAER